MIANAPKSVRMIIPSLTILILLCTAGCGAISAVPGAVSAEKMVTPSISVNEAVQGVATLPKIAQPTESGATAEAVEDGEAQPPRSRLGPEEWKTLPVVPRVSSTALEIYRRGQELGNNPRAFSKVGDCESVTEWFLADFDKGPAYYSLGKYTDLQEVLEYFAGSYRRLGRAARPGFTAASLLTPLWTDRKLCQKDEPPIACELREHKPSFILITLGTNDVARPAAFEGNLRKLIEFVIGQGVVPVLSTKADNLEGNHEINATIAQLAHDYDLPLWNFWAAVQGLPDQGLQEDGAHLTFGPNQFDDPRAMRNAWAVRNLTALQTLDALRKAVQESP